MQAFGAQITLIQSDNKKITEKITKDMIDTARRISQQPGHWWVDQISNQDAAAGNYSMGEEIWEQTAGKVDAFAHSVGSAHSLNGVTKALRQHKPELYVAVVEPAESAVLSGKPKGSHKIEGIGIGFIPTHWKPDQVDEILTNSTEEAIQMCRRLAREEGIFAGASSGLNVLAALRVAEKLGSDATVATLMVDSGLRYLSTDVYRGDQ